MAVPSTPTTWVDGSTPGATDLNVQIRDNMTAQQHPPVVHAIRTTAVTSIDLSGFTNMTWASVPTDTVGMWSAGTPSRFTCQTGWDGQYFFNWQMEFADNDSPADIIFYTFLSLNGSIFAFQNSGVVQGGGRTTSLSAGVSMVAGDYIIASVRVTAGSTDSFITADPDGNFFDGFYLGKA